MNTPFTEFKGEHCELNIDNCPLISTCTDNHICVDKFNAYSCECPKGISYFYAV